VRTFGPTARPGRATTNQQRLEIDVGFDSEWVDASYEDCGIPPHTTNRILSWQLYLLSRSGPHCSLLVEAKGGGKSSRLQLKTLLGMIVRKAIWEGIIPSPPDIIHLAAHFSRADLSTLRDFSRLKRKFSAVRRTYATTMKPLVLQVPTNQGTVRVSVRLVDTMLIAPAGASLASLGASLGVPKVDLPPGYSKDRMDLFKRERPEEFARYALADAEIAARWAARVFSLVQAEMGVSRFFPTLGGVGVAMIETEIARLGIDVNAFFGREKRLRGSASPLPVLVGKLEFAAQCYHGGRNEAFALGFSPEGREVFDLDLCGAYTTAMALISVPNWQSVRDTKSLSELATIGALALAYVRFSFPNGTRIPSLPVRASMGRGLVYPRTGSSWCTGPELIVALSQGAEIEVLQGLRIDYVPNSPRPFEEFTRKISQIRKDAKARGDQVLDNLAKEVGNSAYGKIAQAVASERAIPDDVDSRRVFDVETDTMRELGPSRISQPMLAAFITGAVRAVVCEALARIHGDHWIGSVTTDGFLSTAAVEAIDQSGPMAQSFLEARVRISPDDPKLWELKHREDRVLVLKTRGAVSCSLHKPKPLLARAGNRLAERFDLPANEVAAFLKLVRDRTYETRIERKSLISLSAQHLTDADLVPVTREVRVNLDYDLKRRPANVHDDQGLLTAETTPWDRVEDFEKARDVLEAWKLSQRRVLKTCSDYNAMIAWAESVSARRAAGVKSDNSLGPLAAAFLRIVALRAFGVKRVTDDELGTVMTALCGIEVSRWRISNARRRGRDPEKMRECFGVIPATDEGLIRRLYRTRPDVLRQVLLPLLTPHSAAIRRLQEIFAEEDETELERSEIEWLERFHDVVRDDAVMMGLDT
jgi:hypothetical protein